MRNSALSTVALFELRHFSTPDLFFLFLDALVQLSNKALALCHSELSQASNNFAPQRLTEGPGLIVNFKFLVKRVHSESKIIMEHNKIGQ